MPIAVVITQDMESISLVRFASVNVLYSLLLDMSKELLKNRFFYNRLKTVLYSLCMKNLQNVFYIRLKTVLYLLCPKNLQNVFIID